MYITYFLKGKCYFFKLYRGKLHDDNDFDFDFWSFNATCSNISAISWRPV